LRGVFHQAAKAHFRIAKPTLDHPKRVFNLDAYLSLGVFDIERLRSVAISNHACGFTSATFGITATAAAAACVYRVGGIEETRLVKIVRIKAPKEKTWADCGAVVLVIYTRR
jgi:hypothetical protein